jgi:hypothetical protein
MKLASFPFFFPVPFSETKKRLAQYMHLCVQLGCGNQPYIHAFWLDPSLDALTISSFHIQSRAKNPLLCRLEKGEGRETGGGGGGGGGGGFV